MTMCLSPNGRTVHDGDGPSDRLLVATVDGVAILEPVRSGQPVASTRQSLRGVHVGSLLLEPARRGIFAGAHSGGLYRSVDDGETWERKTDGIEDEHVFSLATTVRDGQVVLYAGTEPAHLYESTDYGETWTELTALRSIPDMDKWRFPEPPHIAHVKNIEVHPANPDILQLAVEQGALLTSTDAGQTWRENLGYERPEHVAYRDVHRMVYVRNRPSRLYMVNGNGLIRSDDGGTSWEQLTNRQGRLGYPDGFVISPFDDNVVFLSGAEHNPGRWHEAQAAHGMVMRSDDGGRTWHPANGGLPNPMRANIEAFAIESWRDGYRLVIGTTDGDVFASDDEGNGWWTIASGLPPVSKVQHYRDIEIRLAR